MTAEAVYKDGVEHVQVVGAAAYAGGEILQLPCGRAGYVDQLNDTAAADAVAIRVEGKVTVPKTADIAILDGGEVYWDTSAGKAHFKIASGDFFLGTAVGDAAAADTEVVVDLNVRPQRDIELGKGTWSTAIVKTAGTPEVTKLAGGEAKLAFSATAEAQKVDLLSDLSVPVARKFIFRARAAVFDIGDNAALDANIGVANTTHATDADAITESCFIHFDGTALDIKAESDDGTTEVNATDTTVNAVDDTYFEIWIDGRDLTDIQIYLDGVLVLGSTVFKLNAATGPLKALVHMEKTSDDTPGEIRIESLSIQTFDVDVE